MFKKEIISKYNICLDLPTIILNPKLALLNKVIIIQYGFKQIHIYYIRAYTCWIWNYIYF